MYTILIVDDEPEIAEGIAFLIERGMAGRCEVVGTAQDGAEGEKLALSHTPDIILTDIRMPDCDGLQMIERLRDKGADAEFVVLSGYADFQYARTAMRLGVNNYLTKPVDEDELNATLERICQSLDERRESEQASRDMQRDYARAMLRDFLRRGEDVDAEALKVLLPDLDFTADAARFICCLMSVNLSETQIAQLHKSVLMQTHSRAAAVVELSENQSALLIASDRMLDPDLLSSTLRNIKRTLPELPQDQCSIGVGISVSAFESLPESLETAKLALSYRIVKGGGSVISYPSIQAANPRDDLITLEDVQALEEAMDRMDDDACARTVHGVFARLAGRGDVSLPELRHASMTLLLSGLRRMPSALMLINQQQGDHFFTLENLEQFESMAQLEHWIIETLLRIHQTIIADQTADKRDVVEEAKRYIKQNFDQNISLNDISERFFINPYYFSHLFKKKTGVKYQDYVIQLRIERAKVLLRETNLTLREVCEKVGYSDMNHFNRVFERTEGVKPNAYRKAM